MRDREDYFKDYVEELYKKEKEDKKRERDRAKSDFKAMLTELTDLHRKSKWSSTKKRLDSDERYKNKHLDSALREQLFRDYVADLPPPPAAANEMTSGGGSVMFYKYIEN